MTKNPAPPKKGTVFLDREGLKLEVRAIVDKEKNEHYGWNYQIVFKFFSEKNKRWSYVLENAHALGVGLYKEQV